MKIQVSHWLYLGSYLSLTVFMMLWAITLSGLPEERISIALILFIPPLLLPLRGVLAGNDKALIWGSLVSLIYLVHGGMTMWTDAMRWGWGLLELLLALTFLVSSSFNIRWRAAEREQAQANDQASEQNQA